MDSLKQSNGYAYTYDAMNRIKSAMFKEKTTTWAAAPNDRFSEFGYQYDLTGNLKALTRYNENGSTQAMDNLSYDYGSGRSNRLLNVADIGNKLKGFAEPASTTGNDYAYDGNGNMIVDQNKGISAITYNLLNLPASVSRGGNSIRYIYDASGRKLAQVLNLGSVQKQVDYVGEFQYEADALQHIAHEEGRIVTVKHDDIFQHHADATVGVTGVRVSLASETNTTSGEKYVKATVTSTGARTGITSIGTPLSVGGGERLKIRVKGYRQGSTTASNPAYISVKGATTVGGTASDLLWPGSLIPEGAINEAWSEVIVDVPANIRQLTIGVNWNTTVSVNEVLFLNELEVIKETTQTPEYQYFLKDHLGNVRLTFTSKDEADPATATYEAANASVELSKFLRTENVRKISTYYFDRTNGTKPSTTPGYAQRLSGGANEQYGLARSISVMPGDRVSAEVYAKYRDMATNDQNFNTVMANIASAIASGNTTSGLVVDGGSFSSSTSSFPFPALAGANTSGSSGTGPKAFLNWLIFDRNYNLIEGGYDRIAVTAKEDGTDVAHDQMVMSQIKIKQPGYVYIYLSNEESTPWYVYFDDFTVQHTKSPVIQIEDYYPFGLTFNSFRRESSVTNQIKFQDQEHVDDLNLGWDSFKWRNHQPEIGRFFNVDPLAHEYVYNSTYAFSENKVVVDVELEGLESEGLRGPWEDKIISGFKEFVENGAEAVSDGIQSVGTAVSETVTYLESLIPREDSKPEKTDGIKVVIVDEDASEPGPNNENLPEGGDGETYKVDKSLIDATQAPGRDFGGPTATSRGKTPEGGQPKPTTTAGSAVNETTSSATSAYQAKEAVNSGIHEGDTLYYEQGHRPVVIGDTEAISDTSAYVHKVY